MMIAIGSNDLQPGKYDFGLNAEQEARAAKIHAHSIVFDMLSMYAGSRIFSHYSETLRDDLRERMKAARTRFAALAEAIYWPFEMAKSGKSDLVREWFTSAGLTCGAYEIGLLTYDERDPLLSEWNEKVLRYADLPWFRFATTAAHIRDAKRDGAIAFYANCQPIVPAPRDLAAFEIAYVKGLRSLMLTYNRMDHIGVGCTERVDAGLSMFGIDVVKQCNDLGIMVDVSHCGHLTTMDACRSSTRPVNANHTCARAIYAHARAKSDVALRAIADTGGVVGVLAVPHFLSDEKSPTIHHMLDHIDHIANLIGWRHVAIGTDWPWPVPDEVLASTLGTEYNMKVGFREQDRIDRTARLVGFEDCRDLPNITRGLVARGYSDEQITGILGGNALRVFESVCG